MPHTSNFLISSSNASRSSLYIHILLLCESYSLFLCHTGTYLYSRPPPPGYWYRPISLLFLVGPGPLHEIAVSDFCVVHWAVQVRFHSNIFPQPPVYL